jgi:hypothetical protein
MSVVGRVAAESPERFENFNFNGTQGTLFRFIPGDLLMALHGLLIQGLQLPQDEGAFGRRLQSANFRQFRVLGEEHVAELKRQADKRFVGIFVPSACWGTQ